MVGKPASKTRYKIIKKLRLHIKRGPTGRCVYKMMNTIIGWEKPSSLIDAFFRQNKKQILFVTGPVGTGKSSITRHFALANGYRLVEATGTATLNQMRQKQRQKRLICIDDLPSAIASYPQFESTLFRLLRKRPITKIFVAATDGYKYLRKFEADQVWTVKLYAPYRKDIRSLLTSKSWKIATAARGDVRKALQLDRWKWGDEKSEEVTVFELAEIILGDKQNRNHHAFTHQAVGWAYDNYLVNEEDIDDVVEFAERFSAVDWCREALPSLKAPTPILVPKRRMTWDPTGNKRKQRKDLTRLGEKFGVFGLGKEELHHYLRCVGSLRYLALNPKGRKKFTETYHLTVEDKRCFASRKKG